jgi:hypothetical protein
MTAEEIVTAVEAKGVVLRINPTDGKLTATPRKKVPADLLEQIRVNRVAVIEFIEARDKDEAPLTIDDLPPPEPPKPPVAEQLITAAWEQFRIKIELDHPGPQGMLKITTPWIDHPGVMTSDVVIDGTKMPSEEYCNRQRSQIPTALAVQINNLRPELIAHLRAPHLPPPPPPVPGEDPKKRSIWERMARPDDMIPGAVDNQKRVRQLLFGDQQRQDDLRRASAQARFDMALPTLLAQAKSKGKK